MDTLQNVYLTGAAYSVSLSTAPVVGPAFLRTFFPKLIKLINFNPLKKVNLLGITSSIPCSSITWIIGKGYNIEEWYWNRIRVLKDLFQKCFYDLQTFPSLVWLETKMTKEMKTKIVFFMLLRVLRFDSKWRSTCQLLSFLNGENRVSLALWAPWPRCSLAYRSPSSAAMGPHNLRVRSQRGNDSSTS